MILSYHIGADEDVEAVEFIAAQAGVVLGELPTAGEDGIKGLGDPQEDLALDVGVVMTGTEVIEFINSLTEFIIGSDIIIDINIGGVGVKGTGEEVIAREEEAILAVEQAHLTGRVAGGVDDFESSAAQIDDVIFPH